MTIYKSVDKDLYTGILMLYQFGYSQLEISKLSGIDKKIVDRISDSYIVLDDDNKIVDFNKTSRYLVSFVSYR